MAADALALGAPAGTASPIVEHPDVRRMLLTMKAYIEAMRALLYTNAVSIDLARHHDSPAERQAQRELTDLLTPISNAWCTDLGFELASVGLQVHAGMGYVEETDVAQYLRDSRIAPIYEGTNGIQAIDLVTRKVPMRDGGVIADLLAAMEATGGELAGAGPQLAEIGLALASGVGAVREATGWILAAGRAEPNGALARGDAVPAAVRSGHRRLADGPVSPCRVPDAEQREHPRHHLPAGEDQ